MSLQRNESQERATTLPASANRAFAGRWAALDGAGVLGGWVLAGALGKSNTILLDGRQVNCELVEKAKAGQIMRFPDGDEDAKRLLNELSATTEGARSVIDGLFRLSCF